MTFATLASIVEMTCSSVIAAITMFLSSSLSSLLAVKTFRLGFPMFNQGVVDGERRRYYVSMATQATYARASGRYYTCLTQQELTLQ